jgi:hypothetical protein
MHFNQNKTIEMSNIRVSLKTHHHHKPLVIFINGFNFLLNKNGTQQRTENQAQASNNGEHYNTNMTGEEILRVAYSV